MRYRLYNGKCFVKDQSSNIIEDIVYVLSAVTFVLIFSLLLLVIAKRNTLIIKSSPASSSFY